MKARRWSARRRLFFEPLELDLELPDLLVELVGQRGVGGVGAAAGRVGEEGGQLVEQELLPGGEHGGVNGELLGDLVGGLALLEDFEDGLGLDLGVSSQRSGETDERTTTLPPLPSPPDPDKPFTRSVSAAYPMSIPNAVPPLAA
jgi:hypothetical protein